MITPAYSLTSTERVLPRLALDFTTGVLDNRVTITRALNTATRVNSSGLIETVNADLPRFDYSPTSIGTPRGLLIEEQRANLLNNSSAFNNWGNGGALVTADAVVAPDGTTTADDLARDTSASDYRFQTITFTGNGTKSVSVFVRYNTSPSITIFLYDTTAAASRAQIDFGFTAGVPAATNVVSGSVEGIENYGGGWYRIKILAPSVVAANSHTLYIYPARSGSSNGQKTTFWGAQAENGAFATSYIPTTTTSLTRNADAVSMTGTNFSDWYNASEGSLMFQGDALTVANPNNMTLASLLLNGSNYIRYWMWQGQPANLRYTVVASGAGSADIVNAITANTQFKVMCSYATNLFRCALNGAATSADTSGTVPAGLNAFYIGSLDSVNEPFNGHVAKINYYNQSVTSGEVQAFSK